MIPKKYSSKAFVLSRKNYSEADRMLVLYTKGYGKVSVLAKGVRKPKSKKRGHIEVFSKVKFSGTKTKGMDIITEVDTIDNFEIVRKDLKSASVAYFFIETVNKLTSFEEKNLELFNLLDNYLRKLRSTKSLKKLRDDFTTKVLVLLGFWPKAKKLLNPDEVLEKVADREITSIRVGRKVLL